MNLHFTPFPQMETARLRLRQLVAADLDALHAIRSDPEVNRYLDRPASPSRNDVHDFIETIRDNVRLNKSIMWALNIKPATELIGTVCLWNIAPEERTAEIGFESHPRFHGRGYMKEALQPVISYALKDLGFRRISGWTHPGNLPSIRLMTTCGFTRDLQAESVFKCAEMEIPLMIFSLQQNPGRA